MRRTWMLAAALLAASFALPQAARAQDWPTKPVRVIVPFAPGSGTDVIMRFYAEPLSQAFKQSFIVENRPGANGLVGTAAAAKSPPDGYTFMVISNSTVSAAPLLYANVPYDPVKDVVPLAPFMDAPSLLLAAPSFPASDFDQFLAHARSGAKLSVAYANSVGLTAGIALRKKSGTDLQEVSYKSAQQGIQDVMGGQIPLMIIDVVAANTAVKSGKVKPLAITSAQRSPTFPDVMAMSERLPGIDAYAWVGIGAPAGVDPAILAKLNAEISRISREKRTLDFFSNMGAAVSILDLEQYKAFVAKQNAHWVAMAKDAGIKPE